MNLGIVTSYIIAGLLLVTITSMTMSLNKSSAELTMTQNKKEHMRSVSEMLSYDIPKIGYNLVSVIDSADVIQKADSAEIWFYSNIDNSIDGSVETIKWKFTNNQVGSTTNPNDFKLVRTQDNQKTEITLGVTKFRIWYYDSYGSSTPMSTPISNANLSDIKQIEIEIIMQSSEQILNTLGLSGRYVTTSWKKRFSPVNLRDS